MRSASAQMGWVVVWGTLLFTRVLGMDGISRWLIPAFVLTMFIRVKPNFRILKFALLFCLIGDIFINLSPWKFLCVPAFAVAHGFLMIHFYHFKQQWKWGYIWVLGIADALFIFTIHNQVASAAHWIVMVSYLLILSGMLAMAFSTRSLSPKGRFLSRFVVLGALLFYVTDLMVIAQFLTQNSIFAIGIWVCYPPALYILSGMEEQHGYESHS